MFHYLAGGVGLLSVYHVENADLDSETFIDDWYTENFGLWLVDLDAWSAKPLDGWELGGANVFFSRVSERFFVHQVAGDFSQTKIYEVTLDGAIHEHITIPGYAAYPILRIR